MKNRMLLLAAIVSAATGCGPVPESSPQEAGTASSFLISDQAHHGGTKGFFFLPPIAGPSKYGKTFAKVSPVVQVEEMGGRGIIATFTKTSPLPSRVTELHDRYTVLWNTGASKVKRGFTYRIHVLVNGAELGYADAKVASTPREVLNDYKSEFVPLVGLPLLIAFRIEPEAVLPLCQSVVCQPLDACHVAGTCNPTNGTCSNPAAPDGTACASGSACRAGVCTPRCQSVVCQPLDACHVAGACNPENGTCSNPVAADGTICGSGSVCQAGSCTAGCAPGLTHCGDACVDLAGDSSNCGACGTACESGKVCQAGTCASLLSGPFACWTAEGSTDDVIGGLPTAWYLPDASNPLTPPLNGYASSPVGQGFLLDGMAVYGTRCMITTPPLYPEQPPDPRLNIRTAFTVAFWMRGDVPPPDWYEPLATVLNKDHGGSPPHGWVIHAYSSGMIQFAVGTNEGFPEVLSAPGIAYDHNFHHVAGTWEAGLMSLYVDGDLSGETSTSTPNPSEGPLYFGKIGSSDGQWRPFVGVLDEVQLYERALSASEIADLYEAGKAGRSSCVP